MLGPLMLGFVGGVVASLAILSGAMLAVRRAVQRSPLGRMIAAPTSTRTGVSTATIAAYDGSETI